MNNQKFNSILKRKSQLKKFARRIIPNCDIIFGQLPDGICGACGKKIANNYYIWISFHKIYRCSINCLKAVVAHEVSHHLVSEEQGKNIPPSICEFLTHKRAIEEVGKIGDEKVLDKLFHIWNSFEKLGWKKHRIYRIAHKRYNPIINKIFLKAKEGIEK